MDAKLKDISPVMPLAVHLETEEDGEKKMISTLVFIDQQSGDIYDAEGLVDDAFKEAVLTMIERKNHEAQQKMSSALAKATPEQLRAMGIDINSTDIPKKIII